MIHGCSMILTERQICTHTHAHEQTNNINWQTEQRCTLINRKKFCLVCLSKIDWWNHQRRFVMWKTRGRRGRCTTRKSMILVDENSDRRMARVARRIYLTKKLFTFRFVPTILEPEETMQINCRFCTILLPYLYLLFLELKHRKANQTFRSSNVNIWCSLTLSRVASSALSVLERYFCCANRRSNSITWACENAARDRRLVFFIWILLPWPPIGTDEEFAVKFRMLNKNDLAASFVAVLKRCWR